MKYHFLRTCFRCKKYSSTAVERVYECLKIFEQSVGIKETNVLISSSYSEGTSSVERVIGHPWFLFIYFSTPDGITGICRRHLLSHIFFGYLSWPSNSILQICTTIFTVNYTSLSTGRAFVVLWGKYCRVSVLRTVTIRWYVLGNRNQILRNFCKLGHFVPFILQD